MKHSPLPSQRVAGRFFTLVEMLFSVAIVLFLVATTVNFLVYLTREWRYLNLAADMRSQGAKASELFKGDLSFSSPKEIVLHPSDEKATGLSFPILRRADHSTAPLNGDEIDWTHTVIYHLYTANDGTKSIRRTQFSGRDNSMSDQDRLAQLQSVIAAGDALKAVNGQHARTETLVEDVVSFNLSKGSDLVDARENSPDKPKMVRLGVARMGSGKHTFRFETADPNETRQNIGIDALYVTPSGSQLEGEVFASRATVSGGGVTADHPAASHNWENEGQLLLSTASSGAYVEFDIYNDMWMEAEFAQPGARTERTEVTKDDTTGQIFVGLDGNDVGWSAGYQAGGVVVKRSGYSGSYVRLVILGNTDAAVGLAGERMKIRLTGAGLENAEKVSSVSIMEQLDGSSGDTGTAQTVTFKGGNSYVVFGPGADAMDVESDWIDLPFDPRKDYLLTLRLAKENADVISSPPMYGGKVGAYRVKTPELLDDTPVHRGSWDFTDVSETIVVESLNELPLLAEIFVSYPASGVYTSRVFDTKKSSVNYQSLYGTFSGTEFGGQVRVKVRTDSDPGMITATEWASISASALSPSGTSLGLAGSGRYVQFQAELSTPFPYLRTPRLFDTVITWDGPEKTVDLGGKFTFGSTYGRFRVYMDGKMLNTVNANMDFTTTRHIRGEEIVRKYHVSTSSHQVLQEE